MRSIVPLLGIRLTREARISHDEEIGFPASVLTKEPGGMELLASELQPLGRVDVDPQVT